MTTALLRTTACIVGFCFLGLAGFSQRKIYKINPGEKFLEVIPKEEIYSYPDFAEGKVYLKGDKFSTAKLNYNALFGDMQFIDQKGDTLGIADEGNIQSIVINKDVFYYDKGYLKLLANYNGLKLANKKYFSFTNKQKVGGFGEVSSASIDAYDRISSANVFNDLVAKEVVTLSSYNLFYIGDQFNHFKPANKKNIQDIFGKKQPKLQQYLKENTVDFSSEEDLRKLLLFMQDEQNATK